ncbi:hypothetical protein LR48_Vigan10g035500 [Vigna angularis]|uniref:GRF-type domain-containing protein n=1 Tax=Phaseolus angularis TaxID=3914 RepID=A0A0L9VHL6_PHAAN|nr:hypothetical protein LR48_Vigan10g035500 [Vigna angularis]
MHPCSSSSCSGWQKQDNNVVYGGARGGCSNGGLFCYCGMKCVVRTARTVKNKGKQFWGCPKFKNGGEDGGCNYFTWCADHGVVETEMSAKCEGKSESLLNREAMEGGWKIINTFIHGNTFTMLQTGATSGYLLPHIGLCSRFKE